MKEDFNIEEELRHSRIDPGAHVKRSVLKRYARVHGRRRTWTGAIGIWLRPIPTYLATAVLIAAVFVSYFAGRQSRAPRSSMPMQTLVEPRDTLTLDDLEWETARSDLF